MKEEKPINIPQHVRSYGRIKGRKFSKLRQKIVNNILPKYEIQVPTKIIIEPQNLFTNPKSKLAIEIGFGHGEHLLAMANLHTDTNFIGMEPFIAGAAHLAKNIEEQNLDNIKIFNQDARILIGKLPDNVVDRLFILFPDPWPKLKQQKKRLINKESLAIFYRILKIGGSLEIATDHLGYKNQIEQDLEDFTGFTLNQTIGKIAPNDWVKTRYQEKAEVEGRAGMFLNYTKTHSV